MKFVVKLNAVVALLAAGLTCCMLVGCGSGETQQSTSEQGATVTDLEFILPAKQTVYFAGDKFDGSRVAIQANLSDGTREVFIVAREENCTVEPQYFSMGDNHVTFTYGGKSISQNIHVIDAPVSSLDVDLSAVTTSVTSTDKLDLSDMTVTANCENYDPIEVDEFTLVEINDREEIIHEDLSQVSLGTGLHEMKVLFKDCYSDSFYLDVFYGVAVEAENVLDADKVTADDRNYVVVDTNVGESGSTATGVSPGPIMKPSEPAFGGGYLGDLKNGAVFSFHVWSDEARTADILLRASSGYLLRDDKGNWVPYEMGNMMLNRLFSVSLNGTPLSISADAVLEGGSSDTPDPMLWVNWKMVSLGNVQLQEGDNVFTFTVNSDYINCNNASCACNVDRLEVRFNEHGGV